MIRLAAMLVAGAIACQPAPVPADLAEAEIKHIDLTTEFPSYAPGSDVTLRLENPSEGDYGYNLCVSRLERMEAGDWIEVQPMLAEVCTMELRLIEPGGSDSFTFHLDPAVPAGQYRVRTTIEEMATGERLDLPSRSFAVTPRGE